MGLSRRMFTKEFKLAAVQRLERGSSIGEVARALEVNPNVLHRWRREIRQGPGNVFPGHGKQRWAEGRIAELERKIGQQALEIDFLKGCLQRIEEQRMLQAVDWKSAVYQKVQEEVKANGGLTHRTHGEAGPGFPVRLLSLRQRRAGAGSATWICATPSRGSPWSGPATDVRASPPSCADRGWRVNPKRVYRLMREDNLLCVRKRKFVVTTDSNHGRKVYPNLARDMILTGDRSAVAGRYHLHPAARRVRVPGGDSGRLLAPRDRLGAGSHDGRRTDADRAAHGAVAPRRPSRDWSITPTAARSTPAATTRIC